MKIIIFAFISIILVSSLHLDRQKHHRTISAECCAIKGGFQCGRIDKECCELPKGVSQTETKADKHCVKSGFWGSSQNCPGKIISEKCTYCGEQCASKGGKICGWRNIGQEQCCTVEDCATNFDSSLTLQSCKVGKEIKLDKCTKDLGYLDSAFGFISQTIGKSGPK